MLPDLFDLSDVEPDDAAENHARLRGAMAMLSLPHVRTAEGTQRRRVVEIEIAAGQWAIVDAVSVEPERVVFSFGTNGTRVEYVFPKASRLPRSRVDHDRPRSGVSWGAR